MRSLIASPLGFLVGLSLGALGGGGSILAVPALVYGVGESPQGATATSLLVVGVAALIGVVPHWRRGNVRLAAGLLFGVAGLGGSVVGTWLNGGVDGDVLLLAFSVFMVVAGVAMVLRTRRSTESAEPCEEDLEAADLRRRPVSTSPCRAIPARRVTGPPTHRAVPRTTASPPPRAPPGPVPTQRVPTRRVPTRRVRTRWWRHRSRRRSTWTHARP